MDDLISRQEALDAIDELVSTMSVCVCVEECRGMNWMKHRAIAAIEALPAAERVGKWIKLYAGNYKCSVCGDWWSNDDNEMVEDFKYCPNCGARMVKGEENED